MGCPTIGRDSYGYFSFFSYLLGFVMPKGPAWHGVGHGGLDMVVTQSHFYIPVSLLARHSFQSQGKFTRIGLLSHTPTGHYTLHTAGLFILTNLGPARRCFMQEVTE